MTTTQYNLTAENADGTTSILSTHDGRKAADKAWTKARKAGHAKYLPLPAGVRRIYVEKAAS
jgi:hypothetical protein